MRKKGSVILIIVLLLCMVLAACQTGVQNTAASNSKDTGSSTVSTKAAVETNGVAASGFPIVKDKINLDVMVPTQYNVENMDTNDFTKYYEDQTNIHINWQVVPSENLGDKVNISLSSGDVPDIYLSCNVSQTQQAIYGKQGLFVALNQYFDKYGQRFKDIMAHVPNLENIMTMSDGNIYALPYIEKCNHCEVAWKMWVNRDWLKNLGLSMPTTTDEFYDMLVAFRDKDPNGNGKKDEIPLATTTDGWCSKLFTGYLTNPFVYTMDPDYIYLDNGKIKASYIEPGWKDGLKWLNKLYKEELIYSQSFLMTTDQGQALGESGGAVDVVGCIPGGDARACVIPVTERYFRYVTIPPLKGPAGRFASWNAYQQINPTAFVITSKCENPEAAFRWGVETYDKDLTYKKVFGEEGVAWKKLKPGETDAKDPRTGDPAEVVLLGADGEGFNWGAMQNKCWRGLGLRCDTSDYKDIRYAQEITGDYETNPEWRMALDTINNYEPYRPDVNVIVPFLVYTEEQAAQLANIQTVIKNYREEMFARFVTGDANVDAEWDNYINEMKVKGVDKLVQIYQDAYDSKYGKK